MEFLSKGFKFFQDAIGSNENGALTVVGANPAFPVVETALIRRRSLCELKTFLYNETFVGAGSTHAEKDPRAAADWTEIISSGGLSGAAAVPLGHDYLITGVGMTSSASTLSCAVWWMVPGAAFLGEGSQMIWVANTKVNQRMYQNDGPSNRSISGQLFSPAGDYRQLRMYINAAGAQDVYYMLTVIHGPPGTIPMT